MAETIFEKPLDHDVNALSTDVTNLSNSIGTVPSGNTVEGQISALNNKITLPSYTTCNTLSDLQSYLTTTNSGMSDNETKKIYIITGSNFDNTVLSKGERYAGEIKRMTSTQFVCDLASRLGDSVDIGCYNGTFTMNNLNNKLSNVTFKDVSNVNNFTVNLGYTPSASKYGQLIVFNANQGSLNMISFGNATNIVKVFGNITLTASISGQNITVEASGTLWGSTIVMISHN